MCLRNYIQIVVTSSRRILDTHARGTRNGVTGIAVIVVVVIVIVVVLVVVAVVV